MSFDPKSSSSSKKRELKKLVDEESDDEPPMSTADKVHLFTALFLLFAIIFAIMFVTWWFFGTAVFKAARKRLVKTDPTATPAPTPYPMCTRVQEVLYYLGLYTCTPS